MQREAQRSELMEERGLTVREFSDDVGVSESTIYKFLNDSSGGQFSKLTSGTISKTFSAIDFDMDDDAETDG